MSRPLRIVVLGMMGACPFGGQTWAYLNWLRGFHLLGHEVWYAEDNLVWPFDPLRNAVTSDCGYAVRHIGSCLERIGLGGRWAYRLRPGGGACRGMREQALDDLYRSCDVLLNIAGATELREEHLRAPCRVYLETDPVTGELRIAAGDERMRAIIGDHTALATYGEKYGDPDCGVPLGGLRFLKTRQPVDLSLWSADFDPEATHFTTIGNYRQEGKDVVLRGETYRWSKHHEWEKFLELPRRTSVRFELALKIDDPGDRDRLERAGWGVVSPLPMSLDVFDAYPEFIRRSRGEFTVAKDQNVRLRSGWFSDRDATYLASGKPVIAQDTGFGDVLPTGAGLFAFQDAEGALAALAAVEADYARHCARARAIAEEHFEARAVCARLLAGLGF